VFINQNLRLSGLSLLAAIFLGSSATLMAAATGEDIPAVPTLTLGELRAKYSLPSSRFMEVDGMDLHYVDEGTGPVVVLLHASYNSLRTWDGVAERLRDNYRVVRFDFPSAGLSADNKPTPPEKFNMMGRYVNAIEEVVARLGIERFALVATSSGGSAGFRYASSNPDTVERLVLINTAGMPRIPRTDPLRERTATAKWSGMTVRPREFWLTGLSSNFIAPNKPPEWIVDQAYDFARREGRAEKAADYVYTTGDPKTTLAGISSPTLILWGKNNPTVMHLEADVIQHWMTGAPTAIRKYEGLGHYPYVEDLDAIYPDLAAFLAGDLDSELRRTTMLKAGSECDCED
jgi:pimeloyl-ACP methyl ester carboxylesterase